MTVEKILPNQGDDERGFISNEQETAILRMCWEMHPDNPNATHGIINASNMDTGKAQTLDSLVLTPTGFERMGDVYLGQEVVSPDGTVTHITGIFPQGEREVYEVMLVDGRTVRADAEHLWTVSNASDRWTKRGTRTMTTIEIAESVEYRNGDSQWSIETIVPTDLGEWTSLIDPYLLGLLLGDGGLTANSPVFSTADAELLAGVEGLLPAGVSAKYAGQYDYRLTGTRPYPNPLTTELRTLGLMGRGSWDKFIPQHLLRSSIADRLALVQGLLDTDGGPDATGFEYLSASPQLAEDLVWLVRSLGGRATTAIKTVDGRYFRRVWGKLPNAFPPFRLQRKLDKMTAATKYPITHLAIKSVVFIGMEPTQCIMVESDLHEYVTDHFTRTHNTLQAAEVVIRMGFQRVLYIGVKDTYQQWADRLEAQSDGAIVLRRMDNTKPGALAWKDFVDGLPGHFFTGSQYLTAQDWEARQTTDENGHKMWKEDENGERILKRGEPVPVTKQHHKMIFKRVKMQVNPLDLVVFDEIHVVANRKSVGRKTLVTLPTKNKLGMSGTIVGNKFENFWSISKWVWPELIDSSFDRWSDVWCASKQVIGPGGIPMVNKIGKAVVKMTGEVVEGEFVKTLACYIRIDGELEVPAPEIVYVDLLPEQQADYEDLERDMMVWLETPAGQRATLVADLPITLRTRLRTATLGVMSLDDATGQVYFADDTKSTKLHALRGIVDRPDWVGRQVGIYTDSKQFAKVTVKRMRAAGYDAVEWSGDVVSKNRDEIKRKFLAGEIQYLISVIPAFSTGLDGFQSVCSRVIWLSESDNNMLNLQAVKRYFRSGRQEGFQHIKIVARNSYDEGVLSRNVTETLAMHATLAHAA